MTINEWRRRGTVLLVVSSGMFVFDIGFAIYDILTNKPIFAGVMLVCAAVSAACVGVVARALNEVSE